MRKLKQYSQKQHTFISLANIITLACNRAPLFMDKYNYTQRKKPQDRCTIFLHLSISVVNSKKKIPNKKQTRLG